MRSVFDRQTDHRLLPTLAVGLALWLASTCALTGPDTFSAMGTVEFLDVEGGCWTISTDDERYEPTNLPEEFERDGLRISFEAEVRTDLVSVCQIGPIVELREVEPVEP